MNMHSTFSILILLILFNAGCISTTSTDGGYIDSDTPGTIPKVFAGGFISQDSISEFGSVFSKNGKEFFYGVDIDGKAEIRYTKLENDRWVAPTTIISSESYSFNDPFLSPSEDRLYYISDRPRDMTDTLKDYDIWYSLRSQDSWSSPINAGSMINSDRDEYYISFTDSGTMYFGSNKAAEPELMGDFDIYSAKRTGDEFALSTRMGASINTKRYEADVFIAPDESYIIFCANREDGLGRGDLYISFKTRDNQWSPSVNMGSVINSEHHELCPFVTYDNKYLFYTSNQDIYWVSTDVIKSLRPH